MVKRRSPSSPGGLKRVHVGCGPHAVLEDWWNVDIRKFRGIDETMDATEPWKYDGLDFVFAEHFIEHLTLDQAVLFLTHAGNSMHPGGVIRVSTPNLEWVAQTHFACGPVPLEARLMDTMKINRAFHGWGHQFLYSREMLIRLFEVLGYQHVIDCHYGVSAHAELHNLEKHSQPSIVNGVASVVILEAERGYPPIVAPPEFSAFLEENYLRYVAGGH